MASGRISKLQRQILVWLLRNEKQTHTPPTNTSYTDLVRAMSSDKSSISRSIQTLERRGFVRLWCSSAGYTEWVSLTGRGMLQAANLLKGIESLRKDKKDVASRRHAK
jgi:DNA-binding MarR family transcriptional regulator